MSELMNEANAIESAVADRIVDKPEVKEFMREVLLANGYEAPKGLKYETLAARFAVYYDDMADELAAHKKLDFKGDNMQFEHYLNSPRFEQEVEDNFEAMLEANGIESPDELQLGFAFAALIPSIAKVGAKVLKKAKPLAKKIGKSKFMKKIAPRIKAGAKARRGRLKKAAQSFARSGKLQNLVNNIADVRERQNKPSPVEVKASRVKGITKKSVAAKPSQDQVDELIKTTDLVSGTSKERDNAVHAVSIASMKLADPNTPESERGFWEIMKEASDKVADEVKANEKAKEVNNMLPMIVLLALVFGVLGTLAFKN